MNRTACGGNRRVCYLRAIAQRPDWREIPVHTVTELGSATETILNCASGHAIDLIVMATYGRSGIKRWVIGSVAEKVLRGTDAPVLLLTPRTEKCQKTVSRNKNRE